MIDSTTFTQDMLSNPTKLTNAIIGAMEATDTGGGLVISDPNNGFVMQMLANNHIFSKFSERVDFTSAFYYSQRAQTSEQLYSHLSEFDYVSLMATPVTLPFVFAMSKNWIIANAVFFDSNYNKIQIPATSFITMGGVVYSMYYPIDILVNRNTGAVTAFYNTETVDKLYSLESNMLLDVVEYTKDGIDWFQIQFNMFQFERTVTTHTVSAEQGFVRTLSFSDQFYAAKVFNRQTDGSWSELSYSLSQFYYDYKTPTALLTLMTDVSQLKIEIPQIYFTNNQISQTLKIELYTTKGAVSYSLSAADINGLKANFDTSSSNFAAPLVQMPTWIIVPTTIEVAGGSNTKTQDEIRDAVVNQRLYDGVPITPPQLKQAGLKAGFQLTRYIDDLTERMYFASNILTDNDGMVVPTFTGNLLIADDALAGNPSTIVNYSDGYYTILPTTTFKISEESQTCIPMSNGEVVTMLGMTKAEQIAELNKGNYVRQPFHITLLTDAKSPEAAVYNLLSPKMVNLTFKRENPNSAPQMSVWACSVIHQDNGTGGYRLLMTAVRSTNIENVDASNFKLILTCKTKIGDEVYIPATYAGVDNNGNDVWEVIIATNYHITADNHLTVMMINGSGVLNSVEIPLEQSFNVLSMFLSALDLAIPTDTTLNNLLPAPYVGTHTVMSHQDMKIEFGKNLSNQIYCGVNTSWGTEVYDTADSIVYFKTNVPIFQTNELGIIETRKNIVTDALEVVSLYDINATPSALGDFTAATTLSSPVTGNPAVISVTDATGVLIGMAVRGTNVPINSVVTDVTDNIITIDKNATVTIDVGTELVFTNPTFLKRSSVAQIAESVQLTVADTAGLLVGMSVFGFGIPTGATVVSIDSATQFSISAITTEVIQIGVLFTFINTTAHGVVKIAVGDVLTDPTGAPIVVRGAQNQYAIPAILFDGRLFISDDPIDQRVVSTISEKLQNYANQISTIDASFTEESDVFYKPSRTMGLATFGIGNNQTVRIPLSLAFSVTVYVDVAVYNSEVAISTMRASIFSIINEEIQSSIISVSDIANTIKSKLGSNVYAVEMAGVNNDETLRLIALEDSTGTPGIEYTLVLQADNTVDRTPNINVLFLPKPDTL